MAILYSWVLGFWACISCWIEISFLVEPAANVNRRIPLDSDFEWKPCRLHQINSSDHIPLHHKQCIIWSLPMRFCLLLWFCDNCRGDVMTNRGNLEGPLYIWRQQLQCLCVVLLVCDECVPLMSDRSLRLESFILFRQANELFFANHDIYWLACGLKGCATQSDIMRARLQELKSEKELICSKSVTVAESETKCATLFIVCG